jgi:hypothetical protein
MGLSCQREPHDVQPGEVALDIETISASGPAGPYRASGLVRWQDPDMFNTAVLEFLDQ